MVLVHLRVVEAVVDDRPIDELSLKLLPRDEGKAIRAPVSPP